MDWDSTQLKAINAGTNLSQRIVTITGQPGTGKTSINLEMHSKLIKQNPQIRIIAACPTGKAARRYTQVTGRKCLTFHKLLEYTHPGDIDKETGKALLPGLPRRDINNPLEYDVILGDEYEMTTQEIHRNLLNAIPNKAVLRTFGDIDQLDPVETQRCFIDKPSPFYNLLQRNDSIVLENGYRLEGAGNTILQNANRVLRGLVPIHDDKFFKLRFTEQPVKVLKNFILTNLIANQDTQGLSGVDFSSLNNQIISPSNYSWVGQRKLNILLQSVFMDNLVNSISLPRHPHETKYPIKIHVGDKVVISKNNEGLDLFNGETGIVTNINLDYGDILIDFEGRSILIPPVQLILNTSGDLFEYDPRKDINLAYVITTHKAIGSEYDHVIYIMNKSQNRVLYRRNYYTAITRAKKSITTFTDQIALMTTLNNAKAKFK